MNSRDRYNSLFQWYAGLFAVDWILLKAQVAQESNFDPRAYSMAGAMGLAQFMPATFREWSGKLKIIDPDPYNPEHSIWCQAAYVQWLFTHLRETDAVLAAYNFGIGNVSKTVPENYPEETKSYIMRVNKYYEEFLGLRQA